MRTKNGIQENLVRERLARVRRQGGVVKYPDVRGRQIIPEKTKGKLGSEVIRSDLPPPPLIYANGRKGGDGADPSERVIRKRPPPD
ncbi:hypothetical protein TNCV_3058061 [Trichonephila clavipes]|nr:hypothetical protein TNCV_3058061 [Trichonephila clavipes]